jgi:hypothetical protein
MARQAALTVRAAMEQRLHRDAIRLKELLVSSTIGCSCSGDLMGLACASSPGW